MRKNEYELLTESMGEWVIANQPKPTGDELIDEARNAQTALVKIMEHCKISAEAGMSLALVGILLADLVTDRKRELGLPDNV